MKVFLILLMSASLFGMNSTENRQKLLDAKKEFYQGSVELLRQEGARGDGVSRAAYSTFIDLSLRRIPSNMSPIVQQRLVQRGLCTYVQGNLVPLPEALEYGLPIFVIDDRLERLNPRR